MYDEIIMPFLDRLAETGRKQTSIKVNYYRLNTCLRILGEAGRHTEPLEITGSDFQYLKEVLITTRTNETTAKYMLKTLDNLIQFHGGPGVLHSARILWNRPVVDRVFITAEDAARLYGAADPPLRLVIVLGALMGLRREEMTNIRLSDIRTDSIVVHGKGHGTAGLVVPQPMPAEVRREIDAYLPWRRRNAPADNDRLLVFITRDRRRPVKQTKVADEVSIRVKRLGEELGIRVTAHSLRRLFATTVYDLTNHDAAVTKALMRHASINTTIDCYIAPNARAKKEAVASLCQAIRFNTF